MTMSIIYTGMLVLSLLSALIGGEGTALSTSIAAGAQKGITLSISIAGSLCLWSGIGKLLENSGISLFLSRILTPLLHWLFPGCRKDPLLKQHISANMCANILGLGNAATPMGIRAVQRMKDPQSPTVATKEMCRLIVLNTASIQLIPANVAAVRASLGCLSPFDILPAVWVTSLCSAGIGMLAARMMERIPFYG